MNKYKIYIKFRNAHVVLLKKIFGFTWCRAREQNIVFTQKKKKTVWDGNLFFLYLSK